MMHYLEIAHARIYNVSYLGINVCCFAWFICLFVNVCLFLRKHLLIDHFG